MRRLLAFFVALWGLSSCTSDITFTFHKNTSSSFLVEVNMERLIYFLGDSIMKSYAEKDLDKKWKSIYEISKERRKSLTGKDTINLGKRTFLKGLYKDDSNIPYGFALKGDHLSQKEWVALGKTGQAEESITQYGSSFSSIFQWDGKTLFFFPEELLRIGTEKTSNNSSNEKDIDEEEERSESELSKKIKSLYVIKTNLFCKFDRKIKSIQGNHPYLRQIDDHTLQFSFDALEEHPKKEFDYKIIIITK